jgi:hypothetical protein
MAVRPHNVESHIAVGAYDRTREQKMSKRLWAHKHELFIADGGYSYVSSLHRNYWTDRMIPTSSNRIPTSGTRTATVRLCVRKAVCKNI